MTNAQVLDTVVRNQRADAKQLYTVFEYSPTLNCMFGGHWALYRTAEDMLDHTCTGYAKTGDSEPSGNHSNFEKLTPCFPFRNPARFTTAESQDGVPAVISTIQTTQPRLRGSCQEPRNRCLPKYRLLTKSTPCTIQTREGRYQTRWISRWAYIKELRSMLRARHSQL